MKKLKLEELEVRSLTTSVESQEETKGGTTAICVAIGAAGITYEVGLTAVVVGTMAGGMIYFGSY